MKTTIKIILLIFIGQLLTSCVDLDKNKQENLSLETDFIPIEINDEYRISIPKYMKNTSVLNEEASLQYLNVFKETYIIIIDESKEELISTFKDLGEYNESISVSENYRDIQLKYLSEDIDLSMKSNSKSKRINGLDAELIEIDGGIEGEEIFYFLSFIEGKDKVYMIMAWTSKERKRKYKSTFKKIAESFRQI